MKFGFNTQHKPVISKPIEHIGFNGRTKDEIPKGPDPRRLAGNDRFQGMPIHQQINKFEGMIRDTDQKIAAKKRELNDRSPEELRAGELRRMKREYKGYEKTGDLTPKGKKTLESVRGELKDLEAKLPDLNQRRTANLKAEISSLQTARDAYSKSITKLKSQNKELYRQEKQVSHFPPGSRPPKSDEIVARQYERLTDAKGEIHYGKELPRDPDKILLDFKKSTLLPPDIRGFEYSAPPATPGKPSSQPARTPATGPAPTLPPQVEAFLNPIQSHMSNRPIQSHQYAGSQDFDPYAGFTSRPAGADGSKGKGPEPQRMLYSQSQPHRSQTPDSFGSQDSMGGYLHGHHEFPNLSRSGSPALSNFSDNSLSRMPMNEAPASQPGKRVRIDESRNKTFSYAPAPKDGPYFSSLANVPTSLLKQERASLRSELKDLQKNESDPAQARLNAVKDELKQRKATLNQNPGMVSKPAASESQPPPVSAGKDDAPSRPKMTFAQYTEHLAGMSKEELKAEHSRNEKELNALADSGAGVAESLQARNNLQQTKYALNQRGGA